MSFVIAWIVVVLAVIAFEQNRRLTARIARLERRLAEWQVGQASPATPSPAAMPESAVSPEPPPIPAAAATTGSVPPPVPPAAKPAKDWEAIIGGQWLNYVGAIAVIVAIAFFLGYAFEHQLLTEPMRVLLVLMLGGILIASGETAHRAQLRIFAHGLVGAGISALYLAVYAAFNRYHLLPQSLALAGMIAVTGITFWRALRHGAQSVAVLGWAGGFLTPILLSDGPTNETGLFVYVAFLIAGLLTILYYRPTWKYLEPLTFAGTYGLYTLWYQASYEATDLPVTLCYLTLFWGLFYGFDLLRIHFRPHDLRRIQHAVATNNAVFYATGLYTLLEANHHTWLGPAFLVLAGLYGTSFVGIHRSGHEAWGFQLRHALTAVVFLVIGTYLHTDGRTIVLLWSLEALALVWAGLRWQWPYVWLAAVGIFGLSSLSVAAIELELTNITTHGLLPVFNERVLTMAVLAAAMGISAVWLQRRHSDERAISGLHYGWCLMVLALLGVEIAQGVRYAELTGSIRSFTRDLAIAGAWSVMALCFSWLGLRQKLLPVLRVGIAAMLVGIVYAAVGGYSYLPPALYGQMRAIRVVELVGIMALALWQRRWLLAPEEEIRGIGRSPDWLLAAVVLAGLVTTCGEAFNHYDSQRGELLKAGTEQVALRALEERQSAALSVTGVIYAFGVMAVGIWRRLALVRWLAIGILGLGIVKVFVVDLASLDTLPRILSFLGLGVILLTASYLYQRFRHLIRPAGEAPETTH